MGCLANQESVILTTMYLGCIQAAWKNSLLDYIESTLCCSLSMVPTIYGMRLTNHLMLGSPSPVKLHENIAKDQFLKLKWKSVTDFAGSFKLDFSPVLRNAIDKLAASASRFFSESRTFSEYPLNTYLYILDSLSRRCELLPNGATLQSLFQAEVAPEARLTYRTESAWLSGEPVLQYYISSSIREYLLEKQETEITLSLEGKAGNYRVGITRRKLGGKISIGYFRLNLEDLQDPSFSFLLPKDHPRDFVFYITDCNACAPLLAVNLDSLRSRLITNPTPFFLQPAFNNQKRQVCSSWLVPKRKKLMSLK